MCQIFIEWLLLYALYKTHFCSQGIFCLLKSTWWKLTASNEMFNKLQVGKCDCVLNLVTPVCYYDLFSFVYRRLLFSLFFITFLTWDYEIEDSTSTLNYINCKTQADGGIRRISFPKIGFPNFFTGGCRLKNQEQIEKLRSS